MLPARMRKGAKTGAVKETYSKRFSRWRSENTWNLRDILCCLPLSRGYLWRLRKCSLTFLSLISLGLVFLRLP